MKRYILLLIKDDVKITTLIGELEKMNISAYEYHLNNSSIIFHLMSIEEYSKLIETGNKRLLSKPKELETFSAKVYKELLGFVKP